MKKTNIKIWLKKFKKFKEGRELTWKEKTTFSEPLTEEALLQFILAEYFASYNECADEKMKLQLLANMKGVADGLLKLLSITKNEERYSKKKEEQEEEIL